jgi:formylglycine-generating enzyme required for sulfatase activity
MNRTTWLNGLIAAMAIIWMMATPAAAVWPGESYALCPTDSVKVGSFCMDKYEASVWEIPACHGTTSNKALITKVKRGTVKRADLLLGLAVQRGVASDDYVCADNGQNCAAQLNFTTCTGSAIFAVSLSATLLDPTPITPSADITWFQAQQACSNAGKRLPSNAEWQQAVAGSPDPGGDNGTTDCNTGNTFVVSATGSRSSCVSTYGAFDMVGNLDEWVADWVPASTACPGWGGFSNDDMCLSGGSTIATGPGALLRGGYFALNGSRAGPLTVVGNLYPAGSYVGIGFRCAR